LNKYGQMAGPEKTWIPACAVLEGETGTIRRTAPRILALGYPAPYSVAASSLGFQSVYRALNVSEELACERFFAIDGGAVERPLRTAESGFPVRGAAAIGFSVACETELARVVELLEAAELAPLAGDRVADDPIVIAGGPLTLLDPRLLAAIADVVAVGEAEEALPSLRDAVARAGDKREMLGVLSSGAPGVWVPSRAPSPPPPAIAPAELLPAISCGWSPRAELRDLFLVEAARGCARGCAFCVLSGLSGGRRAFRPVPAARILAAIPASAPGVGLVGAAVTDHPEIEGIAARIVADGKRVSLSSVRADRLTPALAAALVAGGSRSLTLAADGSSERLRRAIHKGLTADDLRRAAALAAEAGIRQLKVYAMVGLPGETDEDVAELAALLLEFPRQLEVTAAVQAFVPKPGTPLAGAAMAPQNDLKRRLELLKKLAKGRYRVSPTSPRWSWIDWKLAHAGEAAGRIAIAAHRGGGDFAAWKRAIEGLRP
jgi:radical SAM superfamily enzyme YgiQ (UPF0313 family)